MGRLTSIGRSARPDSLRSPTIPGSGSPRPLSPSGPSQYCYDAAGNLTALKYSDGTSLSLHLGRGQPADRRQRAFAEPTTPTDESKTQTVSQITRDAAGRIASVTYAPGKTVNYTYNNRGLLSQVTDWVGGNTTFTYDAAGELTAMAFANGVNQAYTWDADGRVLTLTASKGGTTLSSITLTRDALGRVTSAARSAANIPAEAKGTLALAIRRRCPGAWRNLRRSRTSHHGRPAHLHMGSGFPPDFLHRQGRLGIVHLRRAGAERLSRTSSGVTQNYVWNYAFPLPVLSTVQSGGDGSDVLHLAARRDAAQQHLGGRQYPPVLSFRRIGLGGPADRQHRRRHGHLRDLHLRRYRDPDRFDGQSLHLAGEVWRDARRNDFHVLHAGALLRQRSGAVSFRAIRCQSGDPARASIPTSSSTRIPSSTRTQLARTKTF